MNSVGKTGIDEPLAEPLAAREIFRRFANHGANALGSPWPFLIVSLVTVSWLVYGHLIGYSEKWLSIANTAMTLITFLMVFLIQNTQYRETRSMHLKLDELIKGVEGSRTSLVGLEKLSDDELDRLQEEFKRLRHRESATQNEAVAK